MGLFEYSSRSVCFAPLKEALRLWHLPWLKGMYAIGSVGLEFSKVSRELCLGSEEQGGKGPVHGGLSSAFCLHSCR